MTRLLLALCAMLLLMPPAAAIDLPFSLGPISCRTDAGTEAEIPSCEWQLGGPNKSGSCVVRTGNGGVQKRHLVQATATPIGWREMSRGPDPLVFSHHGVTCWLMIPAYVEGYRCQRTHNGLDCTACLKGECYRGQMSIRELEELRPN